MNAMLVLSCLLYSFSFVYIICPYSVLYLHGGGGGGSSNYQQHYYYCSSSLVVYCVESTLIAIDFMDVIFVLLLVISHF